MKKYYYKVESSGNRNDWSRKLSVEYLVRRKCVNGNSQNYEYVICRTSSIVSTGLVISNKQIWDNEMSRLLNMVVFSECFKCTGSML